MTKTEAFNGGKGLTLAGGLWYYSGVFHQIVKGNTPVRAVNQAKLKAEHSVAIEKFLSVCSNTNASVIKLAGPSGTNHERRQWVERFTRAAQLQRA